MTRKILLTVDKDGNIHSETHGFKGDTCLTTLRSIFAKAGIEVKSAKIERTYDKDVSTVDQQTT